MELQIDILLNSALIYLLIQFIDVVSSTIKNIVTIKASKRVASIVNTLHYTINAVVVKLISGQGFVVVIVVTVLTNLIGVPLGKAIVEHFTKDRLWVYNATIKCTLDKIVELKKTFKMLDINSLYTEIDTDKMYKMEIYSYSKANSSIIKNVLKKNNAKWYIIDTIQ